MRQVNLAIASLTHAHVRKYYQTLNDNNKINWVAVSCADEKSGRTSLSTDIMFRYTCQPRKC